MLWTVELGGHTKKENVDEFRNVKNMWEKNMTGHGKGLKGEGCGTDERRRIMENDAVNGTSRRRQ